MSKSVKSKLPGHVWDVCEASAPRRSARWGATDRGWLYSRDVDPSSGVRRAVGNYLQYPQLATERADGCAYHAVVHGPVGPKAVGYCATAEYARRFIEENA